MYHTGLFCRMWSKVYPRYYQSLVALVFKTRRNIISSSSSSPKRQPIWLGALTQFSVIALFSKFLRQRADTTCYYLHRGVRHNNGAMLCCKHCRQRAIGTPSLCPEKIQQSYQRTSLKRPFKIVQSPNVFATSILIIWFETTTRMTNPQLAKSELLYDLLSQDKWNGEATKTSKIF